VGELRLHHDSICSDEAGFAKKVACSAIVYSSFALVMAKTVSALGLSANAMQNGRIGDVKCRSRVRFASYWFVVSWSRSVAWISSVLLPSNTRQRKLRGYASRLLKYMAPSLARCRFVKASSSWSVYVSWHTLCFALVGVLKLEVLVAGRVMETVDPGYAGSTFKRASL
jgi:hypothetical protein